MSLENFAVVGDNAWEVKSANSNYNTYSVSCVSKSCQNENCQERCIECNVCIHQYRCNCPDSLITHSICKHIYLGRKYTMETVEYPESGEHCQQYMSTEQLRNEIDNINVHIKSEGPIDVEGVKGRILQKLLRIMNGVQLSNDIMSLKQLDKSLNAAENLFISLNKSKSLTHLHTVTNAPANKKIDVQKKFYSTIKKKKAKTKS